MGILSRLLEPKAVTGYGPGDDYWYAPVGWMTAAGLKVTPEAALRISAVYACVKVLAETVAMLPLIIYRRRADGGKDRATNHPIYDLLHDSPNVFQSSFEWREMVMGHLALRGNAYNRILPGPRGPVDQLMPRHPDRLRKLEVTSANRLKYVFHSPDGEDETLLGDEVFHLRGLSSDGYTGISVVGLARESFGRALSMQDYGTRIFGQNAMPKGVLKLKGVVSQEAMERMKAEWAAAYPTGGAGKTIFLEEGLEWQALGMTNEDAQFVAYEQHTVIDIARWFRMPPHLIQDLQRATFTNIEHQSLEFVVFTIMPWLRRWEQRIAKDLILAPQTYFAEFLVDALLRGDTKARYDAYKTAIDSGWMNRNEARERENMNPEAGLDEFILPMNVATVNARAHHLAEQAAQRIANREFAAVTRAVGRFEQDAVGWSDWLDDFYEGHAAFVAQVLSIPLVDARSYAEDRKRALRRWGIGGREEWEEDRVPQLVGLALGLNGSGNGTQNEE